MPPTKILIYTATNGYRHDSIPAAIAALKEHGPSIDVAFDATEDETVFRDATLAQYDALAFVSSCGDGASPRDPHPPAHSVDVGYQC
jgi:hypothetical protein